MATRYDDDDDDHDGVRDSEYPDVSDMDRDDDDEDSGNFVDTVDCPNCGAAVYEQAERCPACGHYIADDAANRKPLWVVVAAVVCLAVMLLIIF